MDDVAQRIGDGERETVDARLQQAVGAGLITLREYEQRVGRVWAAERRDELEAVARDLPAPVPPPRRAPAGAPAPSPWPPARRRRVVALMSGEQLTGPVAPGQDVEAYSVMGGASVDLRRDDLPPEVHVRAVALMGGVEVLVPRGVAVELSGLSLMGGRGVDVEPARPGAPVVRVEGYALMGGVAVGHGDSRPLPPGSGRVSLTKQPSDRSGVPPSPYPASPYAAPLLPQAAHAYPTHLSSGHGSTALARPGRRRARGRLVKGVLLGALVFGGAQVASGDAVAVFGSTVVDVAPGEQVDVGVLFGSATVVVPNGARVDSGGTMVFGSSECKACPGGTGPVVEVDARGAFGSVEVVTEQQLQERQRAGGPRERDGAPGERDDDD